ncbi:hypothetical protein FRC08_005928 [Ceratobasidium sp. 394]|nr:hypothetical protein FRC08_005928 [Ceratobasidium sp. 394]KAG9075851.1 hypothetical protein FS749_012436 [Ceratobasidium sp. UAMH 11750]
MLNNQPPSSNSQCDGSTTPEPQPQLSSPPPAQPFLGPGFSLTTGFSQPAVPTSSGTQDTVTVTLTTTVVSTIATSITQTQTLTLSGGGISMTTVVIPTALPTTVATVFTTASSGAFTPINAATRTISAPFLLGTFTAGLLVFMLFN